VLGFVLKAAILVIANNLLPAHKKQRIKVTYSYGIAIFLRQNSLFALLI